MSNLAAFNLFLYNILIVLVARRVKRISSDAPQKSEHNGSFWDYVPIVGEYMSGKESPVDQIGEYSEFPKDLLKLNIIVNSLLMIPIILKHRRITLILGVVITWNIFFLERIFAFQLMLIWSLWSSSTTRLFYATVIGVFAAIDIIYLILISQTIKLQCRFFQECEMGRDKTQKEKEGTEEKTLVLVPIEGPIGDGFT